MNKQWAWWRLSAPSRGGTEYKVKSKIVNEPMGKVKKWGQYFKSMERSSYRRPGHQNAFSWNAERDLKHWIVSETRVH